jgi:hypothetical protein
MPSLSKIDLPIDFRLCRGEKAKRPDFSTFSREIAQNRSSKWIGEMHGRIKKSIVLVFFNV